MTMDSNGDMRGTMSYRYLLPVGWAVILLLLSSIPSEEMPDLLKNLFSLDKLMHVLAFAILGSLSVRSFGRDLGYCWIIWILSVVYGVMLELWQGLIPGRVPSFYDGLANALGAAFGVLFWMLLSYRKAAGPLRRGWPYQSR